MAGKREIVDRGATWDATSEEREGEAEVLAMWREAMKIGQGKRRDIVDNVKGA